MRSVDFLSPIRRRAPLNKGLLRWWITEPRREMSPRLRDLTSKTSMPLTGALSLGQRGRVGGSGSRVFDGVNNYGQTAAIDLSAVNTLTLAMWVYWDDFTILGDLMLETSSNYNNNTGAFILGPNVGTGNFDIGIRTGVGTFNYCHFTRPSALAWHHYAFCMDRGVGANQITAIYVDGVSQSLTYDFTSTTGTGGFGNYAWNFFSRNGANNFGAGRLDDIRLYNRVLPAWEVRALLHASRRGYPHELRWSRGAEFTTSVDAAGTTFNYYNRRRRNA